MIGGYRIIRKLAAGGFGVVYLAIDGEGQQVAVKEYLPSSLATRAPGALLPQRSLNQGLVDQYFADHPTIAPIVDTLGGFEVFAST